MRRARRFLALVLSFAAGCAAALPVSDRRPVPADGELRLHVDAGRIVLQAASAPEIGVQGDLQPGQALRWRETSDGWVLRVEDADRLQPRDALVTLQVPPTLRLRIDAGEAAVSASGVGGGGLLVRGGRGALRIAAVPGGAAVDVETRSGDVELALGATPRLRATTLSGAIRAGLAPSAGADLRLETLSGPINLRLPPGVPVVVRVRSASGAVGAVDTLSLDTAGRLVRGEGGGRIEVRTLSGPLTIVDGPEQPAPSDAGNASEPSP